MSRSLSIKQKIDILVSRVDSLETENNTLREEVDRLNTRLLKYENPKNSSNSSKPPSSDFPKQPRTQSLREKSDRKPGGQPGHKGNTLKMVDSPNIITEHKPNYCTKCGKDISSLLGEFIGKRQVIDIPPIQPVVTEHRVYKKFCSCGHCNESSFPDGVQTPVSYGSGVQAMVAYLNTRQYMSISRTSEMFKTVFGIELSTGGVCHILQKMKHKAQPAYESIRQFVLRSTVIGGDETGVNINSDNYWAWAFQNPKATYIAINKKRGYSAIEEIMPEGFINNILVTDCWASYFKTEAFLHQLCTAHLLRELKYFNQQYPNNSWISRLISLIDNALELRKRGQLTQMKIDEIHRTFTVLLKESAADNVKDIITFQNRMIKYKDYVFAFIDNPEIPPDNNGSERAIRNFKVKQKVSGFFKSIEGSNAYAVLRSVIDTAIKNNKNPYLAIQQVAQYNYATE
jgi:transposase